MEFSESTKQQLQQWADAIAPYEACGVVLEGDRPLLLPNSAADPRSEFVITEADLARAATDEIIAIWHSHTEGALREFSPEDIDRSRKTGMPYLLLHQPTGKLSFFDPNAIPPLFGRTWALWQNCSHLVADIYRQELGIELTPFSFERPNQWEEPGFNPSQILRPLEQGFSLIGSSSLVNFQKYDVIVMRLPGQATPGHLACVVDPERNLMLHHLSDRPSESAVYGGFWAKCTEAVYRHSSQCSNL